MNTRITRALLSVSDKTGIVDFGRALTELGVQLLSTGGTFKLLQESGVPVTEVSEHTGFPEIMGGRVKTLHPKIHGGILARRGTDDEVAAKHEIDYIDLVAVNLYPFAQTIAKPSCSFEDAIENIDIGGPTMVRSAAKNQASVGIVVDPVDYARVIDELQGSGHLTQKTRSELAAKAFAHTANYDAMISNYLTQPEDSEDKFSGTYSVQFEKKMSLRYGENPHQSAAFYVESAASVGSMASAVQHQGKELSFNNIADADAALECVKGFDTPACVIVKHANPCGVALYDQAGEQTAAYQRAFATDPESSFGGIIAFNRELSSDTAKAIIENQFVEVILAPSVAPGVLELCAAKKNVRLLTTGALPAPADRTAGLDYKRVAGGLLVQDADLKIISAADLKVVTKLEPTEAQIKDLLFAWKVAKCVKSNAIVYAHDQATVGVGAGQMSRVNSARIAAIKAEHAGLKTAGAVMASDAFFPFRDGIDNAAEVGIKAIIQPGGSMRDNETIEAANEHGITMVFTGVRHFKH